MRSKAIFVLVHYTSAKRFMIPVICIVLCAFAISILTAILPAMSARPNWSNVEISQSTYVLVQFSETRGAVVLTYSSCLRTALLSKLERLPLMATTVHKLIPNRTVFRNDYVPRWAWYDPPDADPIPVWYRRDDAFGFPMRCMHAYALLEDDGISRPVVSIHRGISLDEYPQLQMNTFEFGYTSNLMDYMHEMRIVPTGIILSGMIVNVMFYLILISAGGATAICSRRYIRRLGGKCERCGYSLYGIQKFGCPECGWNRPAGEGEPPAPAAASPQPPHPDEAQT